MAVSGNKGTLWVGVKDTSLPAMTEVTIVKDVTFTTSSDAIDVSTRAGNTKTYIHGMKDVEMTFDMVAENGNTEYDLISAASENQTVIALAAMSLGKADSGSEGPNGNWIITDFSRPQPLNDVQVVSVTCKPFSAYTWESVA